ncbi:response regulator transcription factor [Exiguobacterium sp. OS-77]|uniref:response regulator transcription factor n=1 Tax=Exiguobacterium sp. OS-77 TaxID=1241306 RepID=UPI000409D4FF|nr:response regulator transcription factor [Exiguobacterium sp. OS-77]
MRTIALVDDENRMLELLELYLQADYRCIKLNSGREILNVLENEKPDLIILDVMMPKMDGFETCERIRQISTIPIILLTALDGKEEIVRGLQLGADDYIVKPFDGEELKARIQSLFRRSLASSGEKIESAGLVLKEDSHELYYHNQLVKITPKEFYLLTKLLKNPERVYSREELLTSIWSTNEWTDERTVDSHVRNLRDKLRRFDFPVEEHFQTVWGVGYKWIP